MKIISRLLSASFLITLLPANAMAAIFADTYVCRPTNADTSLESAVRLSNRNTGQDKSFIVNGHELGRVRVSQGAFGLEAVGSVTNIADATMDYKLIVPQVALNEDRDPYQVNGVVVRSLVGTFHPPSYVHVGPVQYLEFEPVGCEASSSL